MSEAVTNYLTEVNKKFQSGIAREHAYRGLFETLIQSFLPTITVTNEPSSVTDCGNPDFVLMQKDIPVGYIEAKDIGKDLNHKSFKEQFTRYRNALDNLIITDYLYFQFFQNSELVHEIRLADIVDNEIIFKAENFTQFENLIRNFTSFVGQTIKSPKKLAGMMAGKARLLQNILCEAVKSDERTEANTDLQGQYESFKSILIHDLEPKEFSDIYAQTLAYGMFAARLHDESLEDFSRQEAAELIPKTNPFLRKLFQYVAGYDIDARIKTVVDNLAEVFRATNIKELLKNFGKATQTHDPIIHFYETFLSEYDPKLRKSRGVWYTPEPVVKFIVRAVDDVLKSEFGLKDGLADTSKTTIEIELQGTAIEKGRNKGKALKAKKDVHKVQILDPATGTGTFLAEVIKFIYDKKFKAMHGVWPSYVENELIPRLNGFELLMASYAMAHLKLDLILKEMNCEVKGDQRFNIYLTNSLEEHHPDTGGLFSQFLSTEANEANSIKRDSPIMCVIGNPPYSGESSNKGKWIMDLMEDYKKEPGGKEKLKEKNPKWINDDYVKFLRYGQHFIEENGEGILSFINPHGFLDNPTFRGMRWNLLKTYDKIYTIDLHGNSKKKEVSPDGSKDENVFDIQQGVAITIFVKTGKKKAKELGDVFHYDFYGKREDKYNFLNKNSLKQIPFVNLPKNAPAYFMVQKDFELQKKYNLGFSVNALFRVNSVGVITARDAFCIQESEENIKKIVNEFPHLDPEEARIKYSLGKDVRDWKVQLAQDDIRRCGLEHGSFCEVDYRPFDTRWTYYTGNSKGFHCMPRGTVMKHFLKGDNIGLITARSNKSDTCDHFFITKNIMETKCGERTTQSATFPLYLYPEDNALGLKRTPNLDKDILERITKKLALEFTVEKEERQGTFTPIDILDYIYAVLHSPTYREKYKEFLKIDFPRVPYPKDTETFWRLVKLGRDIRKTHLLEHENSEELITTYPCPGDNSVIRKMSKSSIGYEATSDLKGRVWINDEQYFDKVPLLAWEFYIGGYQPAQKWLKDRHGKTLSYEDIFHYQKIIVALKYTHELMQKIDKISF